MCVNNFRNRMIQLSETLKRAKPNQSNANDINLIIFTKSIRMLYLYTIWISDIVVSDFKTYRCVYLKYSGCLL